MAVLKETLRAKKALQPKDIKEETKAGNKSVGVRKPLAPRIMGTASSVKPLKVNKKQLIGTEADA